MDTVTEALEEARRLMGMGDDKGAAQLLHTAALECHDPAKAAQIHSLATQGRTTPAVSGAGAGTSRSGSRRRGKPRA